MHLHITFKNCIVQGLSWQVDIDSKCQEISSFFIHTSNKSSSLYSPLNLLHIILTQHYKLQITQFYYKWQYAHAVFLPLIASIYRMIMKYDNQVEDDL